MNPDYKWIQAAHFVGFLLWTGGLVSCLYMLASHHAASKDGREALTRSQRRSAIVMDIGALVAIAAGLYLALGGTLNAFKNGGWLHMKLALVVLGLIGLHVYVRRAIRKFRNGEVKPLPSFVIPLALVIIAGIAIIAAVKPTAKYWY